MDARERVLAAVRGGLASLERSRARINDLNVYPVPDGDTGSNLCDTVAAIVEGLEDAAGVEARGLARTATRAALMGARGNSGVILSQIVRGFAESLEGARALTPDRLADALRAASDCAYGAVRQPVEGTMLTAVREMAAAAEASASGELDDLLDRAVAAGDAAVERTPELLDVLRQAGVVDAGAAGLAAFVRGCVEGLRGERPAGVAEALERPLSVEAIHQEPSRYRYCTTFVVEGRGVDAAALEAGLEPVGDSLLVVGERPTVRVHVHTDDPGAALSLGVAMGTIDRVEIADMHTQTAERERRLSLAVARQPATAVVAVVTGEGNRREYRELGAGELIDGGQSSNPSTGDIVAAIERTAAAGVVVLPNNPNVLLAAEGAAAEAGRPVRVLPTRSMAAGLAVLVSFDPDAGLERNVEAMSEALSAVRCGEVTRAVRDSAVDGLAVREGQFLGLAEGRAVAAGDDPAAVAGEVVARLLEPGGDLLTLIRGDADAFDLESWEQDLRAAYPGVEIESYVGGQPLYPLLIAVE